MKEKKFCDGIRRFVRTLFNNRIYRGIHSNDDIDTRVNDIIKRMIAPRGHVLLDTNEVLKETKSFKTLGINELITQLKNIENLSSSEGGFWNADENANVAILAISSYLTERLKAISQSSPDICARYEQELATISHFASFVLYRRYFDMTIMTYKSGKLEESEGFCHQAPRLTYDSIVNFPYWGRLKSAINTLVKAKFVREDARVNNAFTRVLGCNI